MTIRRVPDADRVDDIINQDAMTRAARTWQRRRRQDSREKIIEWLSSDAADVWRRQNIQQAFRHENAFFGSVKVDGQGSDGYACWYDQTYVPVGVYDIPIDPEFEAYVRRFGSPA